MTTLYRILIILIVAAIIGGAIYMAVGGGGSSSGQQPPQMRSDDQPRPEGGEDREGGDGLPFGILKSLVIMSVASGVYLTGNKLLSKNLKPVLA